jgi:hypothetical protein
VQYFDLRSQPKSWTACTARCGLPIGSRTPAGNRRRSILAEMTSSPPPLRSLVDALDNGAVLAAPVYRGRRGHPVAFGRRFLGELASLQGDTGARQILARDAGSMKVVEVDDPGIQSDIDHPDDLTAWGRCVVRKGKEEVLATLWVLGLIDALPSNCCRRG